MAPKRFRIESEESDDDESYETFFSRKCLQLCQVVQMSCAEAEELLNDSLLQSQIVSICLQLQLLLIRVVFILLP